MSTPLALLFYSNSMLGNKLSGQLQDLGYRVQTVPDMAALQEQCEQEKPLVVVTELAWPSDACSHIARIRKTPATSHLPVLAFSASREPALQTAAQDAGVSLLAGNTAILGHLRQLLDQVLQL